MKRIGIYSGVFDPVHNGHVAFAEAAIAAGKVDEVWFILEAAPRRKRNVTAHEHRSAMLHSIIKDKQGLNVLSIDQPTLSAQHTLPWLQTRFAGCQLFLLMGGDLFSTIETWPDYPLLRSNVSFIIARRHNDTDDHHAKLTSTDLVIESPQPHASSSKVRTAARQQKLSADVITQPVVDYITTHQLYQAD